MAAVLRLLPDLIISLPACLLLGVVVNFAFAPANGVFLAFAVPALVLLICTRQGLRFPFLHGWLFGFSYMLGSCYWLHNSLHVFGQAPLLLSYAVVVSLASGLAVIFGAIFWMSNRCLPYCGKRFCYLVFFPIVWVAGEVLRSYIWVGFPWNLLGQALIDSPFWGIFPLGGTITASWFILECSAIGVYIAASGSKAGRWHAPAGCLLVLLVALAYGLQFAVWSQNISDTPVSVGVVQANIPQSLKFDRERQQYIIESYVSMSAALDSDVIVWPETALPVFYQSLEQSLIAKLSTWLSNRQQTLIGGVFYADSADGNRYNAIFSLPHLQWYFKSRLVPLGEYLPLRSWLAGLRQWVIIPMSDLSAGSGGGIFSAGAHKVGISICYEAAFGRDIISSLPQAQYLLNVSNDSWFGDTSAPHQLLQMARVRAAESGRYLVRVSSTGISAIVDEKGRIIDEIGLAVRGTLTADVYPRRGMTPYALWGNGLVLLVLAVLLLLVLPPVFVQCRRQR